MKKLLLIALLLVALVFAVVACQDPVEEQPTDAPTVAPTDAPTDPAPTDPAPTDPVPTDPAPTDPVPTDPVPTDPVPTDPVPTDPVPTDPPPTDPPATEYVPGPWEEHKDIVVHQSFDQLMVNDATDLFTPGQSGNWDKIATLDATANTLKYWGWVGVKGELGQFGYQIDDQEPVYKAEFTVAAEQPVIDAAAGAGAENASRMAIYIDVSMLEGEGHTVKALYKTTDGKVVWLCEFTLNMPAGPTAWDADKSIVTHQSFDELKINDADGVFTPGQAAGWNKIVELDPTCETLKYWGWVGVKGDIGLFGYQIDKGEIVYSADFLFAAEQGVIDAAAGTGADNATRMAIFVPVAGIEGDHRVRIFYKNTADEAVLLNEFTIKGYTPAEVGQTDLDFDSAATPDLAEVFMFGQGLAPEQCQYNAAPYKISGINQLIMTMDGAYKMKLANFSTNTGHAALFLRGRLDPNFGDPQYYGSDKHDDPNAADASVGCAGIYINLLNINDALTLRINVKGQSADGASVGNFVLVPVDSRDLTIVDDGNTITISAGDKKAATIALYGSANGFAKKAVVTANDQTYTFSGLVVADSVVGSDIGFIGRAADACFDAITLAPAVLPANTNNFSVSAADETAGTALQESVLCQNIPFAAGADQSNCFVRDGYYELGGINDIHTSTTGVYAYSVDWETTQNSYTGCFFVRGVKAATPETQFYGTDNGRACGGAGIYLSTTENKLHLNVKSYNGNGGYDSHDFTPEISSACDFTVVDTGDTVYVLESGVLVAKIDIIGTKDYGINGVAADALASKVIVTLADGTVTEIENAAVAASYTCDIGIIARGCGVAFTKVALAPASSVEIPGFVVEPELPETPEEILNAAYALEPGASLEGTYTLTGVVKEITDPYSEQYNNVTFVMIVDDLTHYPITVFRVKGEGADTVKAGDTVTVTGTIVNWQNKDGSTTVEFNSGCTLDEVIEGLPQTPTLSIGDNAIATNGGGIAYDFYAKIEGTYIINWAEGETNGIAVSAEDGSEIAFPYEVTLGAGEKVTIAIATLDFSEGTVNVVVTPKEEAEVPAGDVQLGANAVDVQDAFNGEKITFVAPEDGDYVFSFADGETNGDPYIENATGSEWVAFPATYTLKAGESVTLIMLTLSWDVDVIDIVITKGEAAPAGPTFNYNGTDVTLTVLDDMDDNTEKTDNGDWGCYGDGQR